MGRLAIFLAVFALLLATVAVADPPHTMSYQGVLRDDEGSIVPDDTYSMTFRIYDSPGGGTALWTEGQGVEVEDGVFNVILGRGTPIDLPFDVPYWLGITVSPDPELDPLIELTGAPYAMRATRADTLEGTARVNTFQMSDGASDGHVLTSDGTGVGTWQPSSGSVSGSGDAGYIARFTGDETVGNSRLFEDWQGEVGIGTDTPTAGIHVHDADCSFRLSNTTTGSAWNQGFQISPITTNSRNFILWNRADGYLSLGTTSTERLRITDEGKVGVGTDSPYGHLAVESSFSRAVELRTDYEGLARVLDVEYTSTVPYDATAVHAESKPADYYGIGGRFEGGYTGLKASVSPTGDNGYYGVDASVHGGNGQNYGVYCSADGGWQNVALWASSGTDSNDFAGVFMGDVMITGTLENKSARLRIDHPDDPEGKTLSQAYVASPDMKIVLDGVVTLGGGGEATVELPPWLDSFCRDFRYQLTCVGGYAPVYVSQGVSGGAFRIAGGASGMDVSWQVTGIRKDASARSNPVVVERRKSPREAGKYVDPKAHGAPASRAILTAEHRKDVE